MKTDLPHSDEIIPATEIQAALDRRAQEITARLGHSNPLVITVMNGGLVFAGPQEPVKGRTVLLLDDILDEGRTLATIRARLLEQGAAEVLTAAFALKERATAAAIKADFTGVRVPDRFVFGFGMDIAGRWRNLPSIRAL